LAVVAIAMPRYPQSMEVDAPIMKANMVKGNLCSELQGISTAQSTMTEKRVMKSERAVYSFLRKVIAPCNKHISFKFSFQLIDVTQRITKKGVSKTEVPTIGVWMKNHLRI